MRRLETGKPESGIDSSLYESVVLFEDIIEVFALPELRSRRQYAFVLQFFDGRRVGFVLIDVDDPWRLTFSSFQHLAEEPFGGPFISPGAEHKVDRLTGRIDRAVKVFPLA
jgi:hypothetical protein